VPIMAARESRQDAATDVADTRPMTPVVMTMVLAVLAAAAVLVASAAVSGIQGHVVLRDLVDSVRSGLQRPADLVADLRGSDLDDEDEDGGVDDVFLTGVPDHRGYVDPEELTAALARVRSVVPRR
jgi:hypothetical protein